MKTAKRFAAVSAAGVLCAALFVPAVPASAQMVEIPESVELNGIRYHLRYAGGDVDYTQCDYAPYLDGIFYYSDNFQDGIADYNNIRITTPFCFVINIDPEGDEEALALLNNPEFIQSLKNAYNIQGNNAFSDEQIEALGRITSAKDWTAFCVRLTEEQASQRRISQFGTSAFYVYSAGMRQEDLDDALALLNQYPALSGHIKSADLEVDLEAGGPFRPTGKPITHDMIFAYPEDAEAARVHIPEYIEENGLNWTVSFHDVSFANTDASYPAVDITPNEWTGDNVVEILRFMMRYYGYMPNTMMLEGCVGVAQIPLGPGVARLPLWRAPGSGDVTADGRVNIADAIALTQYNAEVADCGVTEEGLANADVNADSEINADDVSALLEKLANLSA